MGSPGGERGYMDGTDFGWELGHTDVRVYPSARSLAEARGGCLHECGIVEVEVRLHRVVLSPRSPLIPEKQQGTPQEQWAKFEKAYEAERPARVAHLESKIRQLQLELAILKGPNR